jgi:hypothetical protein
MKLAETNYQKSCKKNFVWFEEKDLYVKVVLIAEWNHSMTILKFTFLFKNGKQDTFDYQ